MCRLAVLLLCLLWAATPALAQQDDDDADSIDLGVVVVEADPLPAATDEQEQSDDSVDVEQGAAPAASAEVAQTVEREQLQSDALDTADRVLERQPGFVVDDTFAGSSVSYHGLPGKFSAVT